ncbi:AMP-binding protein [Dactylosporangium sp. NPDC005555]|uniref:AMP-binding protein n=1 Tax=Dactylosporangium sp. NPDC005555 TaxID=3154889 RepID=UPI0033A91D3A
MLTPWQRFVRTARTSPDATAIDMGDISLSYGMLAALVRRAAARLDGLGLEAGSRIGLLATRQLETYVAYLAILGARHVVVPLGADYPVDALVPVAVMADLRAAFVDRGLRGDLRVALTRRNVAVLDLPDCTAPGAAEVADRPLDGAGGEADDTMYVLFTSGSTGRPKGVPITNRNVVHYLDRVVPRYELGPGARMSQTFALTFDPSVFDLFGAWTSGATLVVPRNRELLLPAVYATARRLTHWFSVPSLAAYARRIGKLKPGSMPDLRWTKFIGEPLPVDIAECWHRAAPGSVIENVYGPTELTVSCTDYRLPRDLADLPETSNGTVPIGQVYPGLEWRVVDSGGLPAEEGELLIRGPQRFGGYVVPEDDVGRFAGHTGTAGVPVDETAWYRTGDRIRRSGDLLVHLGRLDRQVKLSGYRIELGDVEAAVRRHPAVTDAAVVVITDEQGGTELFAAWCGEDVSDEVIRAYLRDHVPAHMIPHRLLRLPDLPVNASGKTDYLQLSRLAADGVRAREGERAVGKAR